MRKMIPALALFRRTSSRKVFNIASWHSPHSLTWRWILSLRFSEGITVKPYARRDSSGFGGGFGNMLAGYVYKRNGGLEWEVNLFTVGLHYSPQQPMWFRDMFWRADDEREALKRRIRELEREARTRFHPDVLAAHAEFGGDLMDMQRRYDSHDLH
jgi:hypothetical protein